MDCNSSRCERSYLHHKSCRDHNCIKVCSNSHFPCTIPRYYCAPRCPIEPLELPCIHNSCMISRTLDRTFKRISTPSMTNASNVAQQQHEGYQHELTITRRDTPSQHSLAHECMSYRTLPLLYPVLRCLQRSTAPPIRLRTPHMI